mmetsp:Transcript_118142/g.314375  ORF Transcript_118142/g.314375 Transcript_118142/m.314375 type:complete len:316 (+) Transcript_118142:151-1098(+)
MPALKRLQPGRALSTRLRWCSSSLPRVVVGVVVVIAVMAVVGGVVVVVLRRQGRSHVVPGVDGVDVPLPEFLAGVVDGLQDDLALGERQVIESVHVAPASTDRSLRRNAAASTGDEAGQTAHHPGLVVRHLGVRVAGDQQVQAIVLVELLVPMRLVPTSEMRDGNLPVRRRLVELLLQPLLLRLPGRPHPAVAIARRPGAAVAGAGGPRRVVRGAADVVLRVGAWRLGVHGVGVEHVDVNGKVLVWETHVLAEVLRRHDPAVAHPSVDDLLVPSIVELPAAVVVVAQHAQPGLAVQAWAAVDLLKDVVKQLLGDA